MMKLSFVLLALFSTIVLYSCVTTTYIGDTFNPTESVEVYYAAKDVKKEYKVIGHLTTPVAYSNQNNAKTAFVKKAKEVGADAIIILGTEYTGGKDSTPYQKADAIVYN